MPNQRDPDKRMLGAWVAFDELEAFKDAARAAGMSLTDWIIYALEREVARESVGKGERKARRKG